MRDNFGLEFGADLLRWSYDLGFPGATYSRTQFLPVAGMMWNVWFNPSFAVYPKAELGYAYGWYSGNRGSLGGTGAGGIFLNGGGGILYKLSGGLTLRSEVGYAGLKVGAGWLF